VIVVFVPLLSFDAWCYRVTQHDTAKRWNESYENLNWGTHQEAGNIRTWSI